MTKPADGQAQGQDVAALLERGAAGSQAGDFDGAAAEYRRALALAPDNCDAAFGLASALEAMCAYGEAVGWAERALAIYATPPVPPPALGSTLRAPRHNRRTHRAAPR